MKLVTSSRTIVRAVLKVAAESVARPSHVFVESEKEIVVYRGGWGFSLPDQHTVRVDVAENRVALNMPQRGGTYRLERIEETDDELRVYVAPS